MMHVLWIFVGVFIALVFVYLGTHNQHVRQLFHRITQTHYHGPNTNTTTTNKTNKNKRENFTGISMQNASDLSHPILDYAIKASAHSAYNSTSNTINGANLDKVIQRGCRWLDFDVFSVNNLPVVGFSSSASLGQGSDSSVWSFIEAMERVNLSAFSTQPTICPNPKDPLFVNLRIKTSDASIYKNMVDAITHAFDKKLHKQPIDLAKTLLAELSNKVVVVIDTLHSAKELSTKCDDSITACAQAKSLLSIAKIHMGATKCPVTLQSAQLKQVAKPVTIEPMSTMHSMQIESFIGKLNVKTKKAISKAKEDAKEDAKKGANASIKRGTSAVQFRCSIPDFEGAKSSANPSIYPFITNYGIQVVPFRFYKDDEGLAAYESIFNDNGNTAFLPLATAINVAATS